MMILPPGHAQAIRQRRVFRTREKWMLGGVLAAVAALVIALVISLGTSAHKSANGCVSFALAYSTGGEQMDRCGASAKALCQSVGHREGITGKPAQTAAVACRKAGLPVG
jgi:hypothetical protein